MNKKFVILLLISIIFFYGCLEYLEDQSCSNVGDILKIAYSPNGEYIAVGYRHAICILDSDNYELVKKLEDKSQSRLTSFDDFIWGLDNKTIISSSENGASCDWPKDCIKFWNIDTGEIVRSIEFKPNTIYDNEQSLALSDDGYLAMSYRDHNIEKPSSYGIYIIDVKNYSIIKNISTEHAGRLVYSPDRNYLLETILVDKKHIFYTVPECDPVYYYNDSDPNSDIVVLGWSNDGEMMAGIEKESYEVEWGYNTRANLLIYSFQEEEGGVELLPLEKVELNLTDYFPKEGIPTRLKFSPRDRYIAMEGSYSVSACPSDPRIKCTVGFIAVFDRNIKDIVFVDTGGERQNNNGHFDWSPDGKKLIYLFDGEPVEEIKKVDIDLFESQAREAEAIEEIFS